MSSAHTLATMAVSQATFMEIHAHLLGAGYEHAIDKQADGTDMLDMTGIGIVPNDNNGPAHAEHMAINSDGVAPPYVLAGTVAGRDHVLAEAIRAIHAAEALGFVLTIDCAPVKPLAMGNYRMLALVRPARGSRGDYEPPVSSNFDPDTYDWNRAEADSRPLAPDEWKPGRDVA